MEYLQRLLGTLQQAVDFISSFTAYLLGDETHPGARVSENARETRNRSSHYNYEIETTHYGDVLQERHLEAFEGSFTIEEILARAEVLSVNGAQTTAVKPELPETPYKYKEDYEQKLSDSCQFLADTPQEKLTAIVTGGKQKKDLEGLLEWDPERTSWNGEAQQEVQEKVINSKWKPFRPSKEHEDLSVTGGTTVGQEKELQKTSWTQGAHDGTSNGAQFLGEQQRRLEEAAWIGVFQHVELEDTNKMADEQQVEAKEQEEKGEEEEEPSPPPSPPPPPPSPPDQQEEARMVEAEEGILEATLGEGETGRNQEELVEEKEEVGRSYQWKPKDKEETGGIIVEWGKDQKEILWNKEVQQGAPDWTQLVVEQQRGLEEATVRTGGFQHSMLEEENKMAAGQQQETAKKELVEADDNWKWERNSMAMEEEIQETVVGELETERNQEEVLEEEEKMGRSHQREPKGEVEVEKEMSGRQEKKLEETLWNKVVPQEEPDWEQLVDEQQVELERTASSVEFQSGELEEADKMAERQCLEAEKEHVEVVEEKEDLGYMVAGKEGVQKGIASGGEFDGDQQKVLEEQERSHQWEPKEEAEVEGTTIALEGELEEIWMNKKEAQQGILDWNQLVKKQQRRLVKEGGEGLQHEIVEEVDKMMDGQQLGTAKEEEEELKAEEDQQQEPNRLAVEEGIMECMPDKSETVGDQKEVGEEKDEMGRNHKWELKGEVEEETGTTEKQERELEETLWNREGHQRSPKWEHFVEEKQVELERTASSVAFRYEHLEEREEMVEKHCLEVEKEHAEEEEVIEEWKGMVDIVAERDQNQEAIPSSEETIGEQQEDVEEEEIERSHQWKPKDEVEEVGETTVDQERELEERRGNKEVQQEAPEVPQFVTEQQELQKVAAWTGGLQCGLLEVVDKKAEGQQLEAEQVEGEEVKADEYQQWDPDTAAIKGIWKGMLDEAETEEDYEEEPKGKKDLRIDQWESEETAVNFQEQYGEPKETADNREGHCEKLAGAEENEGDQQEEPARNGAEAKAEEQKEHTGSILEDDEGEMSEQLTEPLCLDKEMLANITGGQLRQLEEKQQCLQQGFMLSSTSLESDPLPGPRTFLVEVTSLDTSAQKERVLLRRKSSIRRAPSLKRSNPSMENLAQEENMTDPKDTPPQPQPQPQPPSRPPLRNFGFGPMHPNMMAELQIRMRKPQ
ncbi:golgin subfamily A member 6-like protein 22 [Sceloporus undulatus]|uniref:golgin subfamily A member 6-like protein 22 n=1 Tax=Sceloporus undulatus TaxID=8520 RepID=UPI001C4BC33C|nr:golgin subfamily A member 6-like protein 22 [Sceloporus undulatus]